MEEIVLRVQRMEALFDEVLAGIVRENFEEIQTQEFLEKVKVLEEYYESGMWLSDYECDERGELPEDLKRGILSQDGLYDVLCQCSDLIKIGRDV